MKKMLLFLRFVLWEYASRLARFRLCAVSSRPSSAFRPAAGPLYVRRQTKKGVFLTVLSFYSAANAAETPPFGRQTAPPAQHCMDIAVMSA